MKINITIPWNIVKKNYLKNIFLKVLPLHTILGLIVLGIPAIIQENVMFIYYFLMFCFGMVLSSLSLLNHLVKAFFESPILVGIQNASNTEEIDVKVNHPDDLIEGHLEE